MEYIFFFIFFVFGLIVGSFLNVVVLRFNTGKTLGGRSACMVCQSTLRWYELIPLFSFLALRGRCRTCSVKISMQYPLVEFATGAVFALLFYKLQSLLYTDSLSFAFTYAYYAVLFALLIIVAVYDIRHKIIPDVFSFVFSLLAFIGMFFFTKEGMYTHVPDLSQFLAGILIPLPFALLWLVSRGRWMGLGDAKLAVGLGFLLGLEGAFTAITLAFWIGAVVGICLVALKKLHGMKSELPLAPFLILGAFIVFIFGFNLFPLY